MGVISTIEENCKTPNIDYLNPLEELLDGVQSSMEELCENLSEFGDTIGEGLSYMEENLDEEVKSMSADFVDDINRVK